MPLQQLFSVVSYHNISFENRNLRSKSIAKNCQSKSISKCNFFDCNDFGSFSFSFVFHWNGKNEKKKLSEKKKRWLKISIYVVEKSSTRLNHISVNEFLEQPYNMCDKMRIKAIKNIVAKIKIQKLQANYSIYATNTYIV